MDRGALLSSVIDDFSSRGAYVTGTIARRRNCPFSFGAKAGGGKAMNIPADGATAAYWLQKSNYHMMAMRQSRKSVPILISNVPSLTPGQWAYELGANANRCINVRYLTPLGEEHDYYIQLDPNIIELTCTQRGKEWFVLRMFRLTSSICDELLSIVCSNIPAMQQPPDISASIEYVRDMFNYSTVPTTADINSMREDELRSRCKSLKLRSVSNNKQGYISALLQYYSNIKDRIQKLLINKWFMKPIKASQYMHTGMRNEESVLKSLCAFCIEHGAPFSIYHLISCGLIAHLEHEWIAGSPDGIALIMYNDNPVVVPIEIKTRCTPVTTHAADMRAINDMPIVECSIDNDDRVGMEKFIRSVPERSHRVQLLHHAITLRSPMVMYVEATNIRAIRLTLIHVSENARRCYLNTLYRVGIAFLSWIYAPAPIPSFSAEILGHAADMHTVQQYLMLWKALREMAAVEPLLKCRSLIPMLLLDHNKGKTGVDTYTRYLANNKAVLAHAAPEVTLWDRLFMTNLLNAYHITCWLRIEQKLHTYETVKSIHNAAHKDFSFRDFLVRSEQILYSLAIADAPPLMPTHTQQGPPQKRNRMAFFNRPEGLALRNVDTSHCLEKVERAEYCIVCRHSGEHASGHKTK